SITYGGGVYLEEVYSQRLERRLNEIAPSQPVRVLNTGVPGYNTQQELAVLQQLGGQFAPNLVVLGWVLNDSSPAYNAFEQGLIVRNMFPIRGFSDLSLRSLLYQSWFLYFLKEQGKTFQMHFPRLVPESLFYVNLLMQEREWLWMKEELLEM